MVPQLLRTFLKVPNVKPYLYLKRESSLQKEEEEREVEKIAQEEVVFVVVVGVILTEEVQVDAGAVVVEEAAGGGEVCQGPEVARVQEEPQREGQQGGGEEVSRKLLN